ncbi:hypothetical protein BH10PSE18_BH10PSE18_23360 [soil metagenome]
MIRITAEPRLWAEVSAAWAARLRALPAAVHPDWLLPLGPVSRNARWQDWAAFLGLGPVTAGELGDAVLRLALLSPAQIRRALLLRGLLMRSAQVRRCIDPSTRNALVAEVGHSAWRSLTTESSATAGPTEWLGTVDSPLPGADRLAWDGWNGFAAAPHWRAGGALVRLWRLQLPPDIPTLPLALPNPAAQHWVLRHLAADFKELPSWCTCAGPNWALNWV